MKITFAFLLVGFLTLCTQLPSASSIPPKDKIGTCPPNLIPCASPVNQFCSIDYDCPGILKCCRLNCSKTCLVPIGKPGYCPLAIRQCLTLNPPNNCDHDIQCEGKKKCCEGKCGRVCVPPMSD